jgi:hypothetical protein
MQQMGAAEASTEAEVAVNTALAADAQLGAMQLPVPVSL